MGVFLPKSWSMRFRKHPFQEYQFKTLTVTAAPSTARIGHSLPQHLVILQQGASANLQGAFG